MRIVIDLQGAQSTGSRNRGIGRYSLSLALAIVRNRGAHEVMIALNGLFPDTIEPIRAAFDGLLPQENIRVWDAVAPTAYNVADNIWRSQSAELVREAFLATLRPDVVHVSSLFEGYGDDAVTSISKSILTAPTAVTLYDLIPYIYRKPYLENPSVETWYLKKIEHLRRADMWLTISESSRQEGMTYLGLPPDRSINISTDANSHFQQLKISNEIEQTLRQKHGLVRPFLMYTGGIDHRKNIEGLIRAFSMLPVALRKDHQLAIVCSVQPENRQVFQQLAKQNGLDKDEVVFTGFIAENELLAFYNLCKLFVFPSWHEGFGLPALEAMRCGAPVIAANTSSLPEVVDWDGGLFDPRSDEAMASTMERALSDVAFRTELIKNGSRQSAKFSWDESAKRAIAGMERLVAGQSKPESYHPVGQRPRLAYVSPLPPEKSGIADYSAELLPELARLYQIDVIVAQDAISDPWIKENCPVRSVEWFIANSHCFERVLYHFGNSIFHQHMFKLLEEIPGIVVLHDFFLSGIIAHTEVHGFEPGYWIKELYEAHGYAALYDRFHDKDTADTVWKYPCNLSVLQRSLGTIVHSPNSLRLAQQWYGNELSNWAVIPLMRDSRINAEKDTARIALDFSHEDFIVCSFGLLGPPKLNQRLIHAWLKSSLAQKKNCHLIFVGENHLGDYGQELLQTINLHKTMNIRITGWTDMSTFRQYLSTADIGVQLRTLSRGETSAAVLDCMNYGLPTIVNANGAMADLDDDAVWKLPDEFSDEQLIEALETLWHDEDHRRKMGEAARNIIVNDHHPTSCANQYADAIEYFYQAARSGLPALPKAIAEIGYPPKNQDLIGLADAIAKSFPPQNRQRQLLIDVSTIVQPQNNGDFQHALSSILKEWLLRPPLGYRVEPVYKTGDLGYRYARSFIQKFLGCPDALQDEAIDYALGDVFFGIDQQFEAVTTRGNFYQVLHRQGVLVQLVNSDLLCDQIPRYFSMGGRDYFDKWFDVVKKSNCTCITQHQVQTCE